MDGTIRQRLSAHLIDREAEIVDQWWARSCADESVPSARKLNRREFKDNIAATLTGLRDYLKGDPIDPDLFGKIAEHGLHRWRQSFELREFVRDWGHLHTVLVNEFHRVFQKEEANASSACEALERLAGFITDSMSASITEYERLRQSEAAALFQDLNRLREQDQLGIQRRSQALREYAHDIRGSLMAIAGAGAVISSKLSGDELVRLADALDKGVDEIGEMLERLLELSKLEAKLEKPSIQRVSMGDVSEKLRNLLNPMAEWKSLALRIEGDPSFMVETDPSMLHRILQNLLVNGLKYTREGWVKLTWDDEGGERWLITVADSGPGLQRRSGSLIAQKLYRSSSSPTVREEVEACNDSEAWAGEGIGLSIVKRLCELLNISITIDSIPGKGTRFILTAPVSYDEPAKDLSKL